MIDVLNRREPLGDIGDLRRNGNAFFFQSVAGYLDHISYVKPSCVNDLGGYQPRMGGHVVSSFKVFSVANYWVLNQKRQIGLTPVIEDHDRCVDAISADRSYAKGSSVFGNRKFLVLYGKKRFL